MDIPVIPSQLGFAALNCVLLLFHATAARCFLFLFCILYKCRFCSSIHIEEAIASNEVLKAVVDRAAVQSEDAKESVSTAVERITTEDEAKERITREVNPVKQVTKLIKAVHKSIRLNRESE